MVELVVGVALGAVVGLIAVVVAALASGRKPRGRGARLEDQGWDAERKRWFEG